MDRTIAVALLALALAAGCSEGERAPREGRGFARGAEAAAPTPSAAPSGAAPSAPDPFAPPRDPFAGGRAAYRPPTPASATSPGAYASASAEAPAAPASPEGPGALRSAANRRDPEAELRARLGDPSSCLSAPASLDDRVSISVSAVVSASGRVTRAEVSGRGLPEADIACVRRRAEAVLLAPLGDAPATVRTTFELTRRAPPEAAAPPGGSTATP